MASQAQEDSFRLRPHGAELADTEPQAPVEDDEEGPLTVPSAPRLRHQRHVLEDTLDPSLPLDMPQQPEGRSSGSAADAAEQPAAGSVQARDSGPSGEPKPEQASAQAHEPNNAMAPGVTEATLEYTVAEAAGGPCQPGGHLQAEQPDQAAGDRQRQAAGQQAEVGRPSTQEPDQAAGGWTPLSPAEGWRTKHKPATPDALPAEKSQGKHCSSSMPHCPDWLDMQLPRDMS